MKTSAVTPADLARSVIAVPPLARHSDLSLNPAANRALIRHLEQGGVRTLMYGGNANFYHVGVGEYAGILDFLADAAGPDTWVLPSVGPDYGKAMDQAAILRNTAFPTAMLLPMTFPFTDGGLAAGIRHFTDALGKAAVVYIKSDNYIMPKTLAALVTEGRIVSVKYAVVRKNPADDAYLRALIDTIGSEIIVSGIGERPAIVHLREYGLKSFTSGSVCIGPRGSMKLLHLLQEKRYEEAEAVRAAYLRLEDCRDEVNPIRVLHDAVTVSGIADMGPMLPMLERVDQRVRERLHSITQALLAHDTAIGSAGKTT